MTDIIQTFVVIHPRIIDNNLEFEIIGVYSDQKTALRAKNHSTDYYITECYNNLIYDDHLVLLQKNRIQKMTNNKPHDYSIILNDRDKYEIRFTHNDNLGSRRTNQMSPRLFNNLDDIIPLLKELNQDEVIIKNLSKLP